MTHASSPSQSRGLLRPQIWVFKKDAGTFSELKIKASLATFLDSIIEPIYYFDIVERNQSFTRPFPHESHQRVHHLAWEKPLHGTSPATKEKWLRQLELTVLATLWLCVAVCPSARWWGPHNISPWGTQPMTFSYSLCQVSTAQVSPFSPAEDQWTGVGSTGEHHV